MPISADILDRRATGFALWSPRPQTTPPVLVIGRLVPGNPPTAAGVRRIALVPAPGASGLFTVEAAACGLDDGAVYHYWFEVDDSRSAQQPPARIAVTDPLATCVDWRLFASGAADDNQPAAVLRYLGQGRLGDADPGGEAALFAARTRQICSPRTTSS